MTDDVDEPTMAQHRLDQAMVDATQYDDEATPNGELLAGIVGADQVDRLLMVTLEAACERTPGLHDNADALCALGEGLTAGVLLGYALGQADAAAMTWDGGWSL